MEKILKNLFDPSKYFILLKLGEITINNKNYYFKNLYLNISEDLPEVYYNGICKDKLFINESKYTGFFTIENNQKLFFEMKKYMLKNTLKVTRLRARTNNHIYILDEIINCNVTGKSSTKEIHFYFRAIKCYKIWAPIGENYKKDAIQNGEWYKEGHKFY